MMLADLLLVKERGTSAISQIWAHGAVAVIVIAMSRAIGGLILMATSAP
jgi:hypothetical protein